MIPCTAGSSHCFCLVLLLFFAIVLFFFNIVSPCFPAQKNSEWVVQQQEVRSCRESTCALVCARPCECIGGVPAGRPGTTGFLSEPACALADPAGCRRALLHLRSCACIGVQWFRAVQRVVQCCRSRLFFDFIVAIFIYLKKNTPPQRVGTNNSDIYVRSMICTLLAGLPGCQQALMKPTTKKNESGRWTRWLDQWGWVICQ